MFHGRNPAGLVESLPDDEARKVFDASGQLFALSQRGDRLVLWIEDDGFWHEQFEFDRSWLPDLVHVVAAMDRRLGGRKTRRSSRIPGGGS